MEIIKELLPIITTVIGVLGAGVFLLALKALKESADALYAITDAYEDKKIDAKEVEKIAKELKEAANAWKLLVNKLKTLFKKKKE